MSTGIHVEATGSVRAPAADVYRIIADYVNGHGRIIPPKYFRNLEVVKGGYGEGTEITFDIIAFGKTNRAFGRVTEPEPGQRIVESYPETGIVTTFVVEPAGERTSSVTISTDIPKRSGIQGLLERLLMPGYLRKVYAAELARIDEQFQLPGGHGVHRTH
jgi:hypothetical protein